MSDTTALHAYTARHVAPSAAPDVVHRRAVAEQRRLIRRHRLADRLRSVADRLDV